MRAAFAEVGACNHLEIPAGMAICSYRAVSLVYPRTKHGRTVQEMRGREDRACPPRLSVQARPGLRVPAADVLPLPKVAIVPSRGRESNIRSIRSDTDAGWRLPKVRNRGLSSISATPLGALNPSGSDGALPQVPQALSPAARALVPGARDRDPSPYLGKPPPFVIHHRLWPRPP